MIADPKISLAIDNCFASKRWTRPSDWMPMIKDMGITLVEASADTECDPLYMGKDYTTDWVDDVKRCSDRLGVRVVNLYSGHGTYATLGLAHTDDRVRIRFRDEWMKAQADTARKLNAGLGFFAHAIHDPALQEPLEYGKYTRRLYEDLANLAEYASDIGLASIGVEQMYSPHQPPWTRKGARALLKAVYSLKKAPFYLTLDVGHMNGQQLFQKPAADQIEEWIDLKANEKVCPNVWVGPKRAMDVFVQAVAGSITRKHAIEKMQAIWEGYDYLFSEPQDSSVHLWLEEFSCFSPIIHLQQSDGRSSPHWSFSPEFNEKGIIKADEVLRSMGAAYSREQEEGMPPVRDEIVLTLEPFIGTAGNNYDALEQIRQSVCYWRQFIPQDGMLLSDILHRLPFCAATQK